MATTSVGAARIAHREFTEDMMPNQVPPINTSERQVIDVLEETLAAIEEIAGKGAVVNLSITTSIDDAMFERLTQLCPNLYAKSFTEDGKHPAIYYDVQRGDVPISITIFNEWTDEDVVIDSEDSI